MKGVHDFGLRISDYALQQNMIDVGYKKLEVYQAAHGLAVEVHRMSLNLPKYEMYEQGSRIRRSSKSVPAQIVEGFGLRKHKNELLLYLNRTYASAEETIEQLCGKLFRFIQSVAEGHERPRYLKDDGEPYAA